MEIPQITVPTRAEIKNKIYFVSDYAIARGANCSFDIKGRTIDSAHGRCCDIWLRLSDRLDEGLVETGDLRYVRETDTRFNDVVLWDALQNLHWQTWKPMDRADTGVLPRIQNPAALGFDLTTDICQKKVTKNGKESLYPQLLVANENNDRLNRTNCGAVLSALRADPHQVALTPVGHYDGNQCYYFETTDSYYVYLPQAKPADQFSIFRNGERCQSGQGYWFLCQPVAADREADNSLQFGEVLDVSPFETTERMHQHKNKPGASGELNISEFALGQWLQHEFLGSLERSTTFARPRRTPEKLCRVVPDRFQQRGLAPQNQALLVKPGNQLTDSEIIR